MTEEPKADRASDIQIPRESVEAAARAVLRAVIYDIEPDVRANGMTDDEYQTIAEAALRAGLKAWPRVNTEQREVLNFGSNIDGPIISAKRLPFLILPLPKEAGDE